MARVPHPDMKRGHGYRYDGRPLTTRWNFYPANDPYHWGGSLRAVTRAAARAEVVAMHPGTSSTDWLITRDRSY